MVARNLTGAFISPKSDDKYYHRKDIKSLTNSELRNKLCDGYRSGCAKCEVNEWCLYGKEWIERSAKC